MLGDVIPGDGSGEEFAEHLILVEQQEVACNYLDRMRDRLRLLIPFLRKKKGKSRLTPYKKYREMWRLIRHGKWEQAIRFGRAINAYYASLFKRYAPSAA